MNEKDNKSLFSELLQNIGFIAAFVASLAQYSLGGSLITFFENDRNYFNLISFTSIILSTGLILGFFSYRFNIQNKIYIDNKRARRYFDSLNKKHKNKNDSEPWGFTLLQASFIFILLSLLSFYIFLLIKEINTRSVFYILTMLLAVSAISIFAIKIFLDNEYQSRQRYINKIIDDKIKSYFIGKIEVKSDIKEPLNFNGPDRQINIIYNDKEYQVLVNSSNPESYFAINEVIKNQQL